MNKFTKQLLTGIVAIGLLAPVATSSLNPIKMTVNAKHHKRHYHHFKRFYRRRNLRRHHVRRRHYYSRSNRVNWRYATWYAHNSKRLYHHYHNGKTFQDGMNDGLNGGYDKGKAALLDMDYANKGSYYKGWIISNAISRTDPVYDGYSYASPRNYKNAIALWRQGKRYGDNTGDEYLQYQNGSWSELDSTNDSNVGANSTVQANLYGNYSNE